MCQGSDSLKSKQLLNDLTIKDKSSYSSDDIFSVFTRGSDSMSTASERNQPVEEPWLPLQSSLFHPVSENKEAPSVSQSTTSLQDEMSELEVHDHHHQVAEKLLPEAASNLISHMESVSTVILINSSICTVQRIAVLEDAKLVELLLEPVKSDVLCDSVYLGVVTKLVPHMGGAFVNIGSSRPSLMDIKHNREPFVFPPFRRRSKENVNESMFGTLGEHPTANDSELTSNDVFIDDLTEVDFQHAPMQLMHNDYEDHEAEDDFDVLEDIKENVNGSIVNGGRVEANCEDDSLGKIGNHLAGEIINARPVEVDYSHDSQLLHLQDVKDSKHGCINENKWVRVQKGTKVVVQVVKEGLGTKGPTLTAYPKLRSRFWVIHPPLSLLPF